MTRAKKQFTQTLLAADPPHPLARRRYETEMQAMFEKSLGPRERGGYLFGAVLALLMAAMFSIPMFGTPPPDMPFYPFLLGFFVLNVLLLISAAVLLFRGYWKGTVNPRSSRRWASWLGITYLAIVGWSLMNMASFVPELLRAETRIFGGVILLYSAVAWVRHRVAVAEDRTTEKLLEIELQLAELIEQKVIAS